jgi:threonine dehydratase
MYLPTIADIHDADQRIRPYAVTTPLIESQVLNDRVGGRILLKCEMFQRTGSFKFRGAYNRISRMAKADFPGGVVACSSGNHAQGVAEAARLCGVASAIVMPADAPALKVDRTKRSGGEVIPYNRETEDRDAIAAGLCEERRADFVSPFDDAMVIAGQGTAGLELAQQAKDLGATVDAVLVPASGGGLTAGVALAMADTFPNVEVYCMEPEGFDDHARSLASRHRERNARASGSICDALMAPQPGKLTFAVNKDRLAGAIAVPDAEVRDAVAFAYRELKVVAEPGGAIGLAAVLSGRLPVKDRTVAVVLSGGNVDPALFASIISA